MNKVLFSLIAITLFLSASAYAVTEHDENIIVESETIKIPFGGNTTENNDLIICVKTDFSSCSSDFTVLYNYSYGADSETGTFSTYNSTFSTYGSEITNNGHYCGTISGVSTGTVSVNASCFNSNSGKFLEDSTIIPVYIGTVGVFPSTVNPAYNNYEYGGLPGENITMALYLEDSNDLSISTTNGDIYYSVRNIKTGGIINASYSYNKINEQESFWLETFTIPTDAPVGIIDFVANEISTCDFGGVHIIYQAIPFTANVNINKSEISMGDTILINITKNIYYGYFNNVITTIEYPNGSVKNIYLNENNNHSTSFTTPTTQQGIYNITSTITHTSGFEKIYKTTFYVRPYHIDIAQLKEVYAPAETVYISAALINASGTPIPSEVNFTFYDSLDDKIATIPNSETTLENNYRKASYSISSNADNGEYRIEIKIKDEYNTIYSTTEYFTVSTSSTYTDIEFSPDKLELDIDSLDEIKTKISITNEGSAIDDIDIAVKNLTSYVSINTTDLDETIASGEDTYFYIVVSPDDEMPLGELTSAVEITISDETYEIPISLDIILSTDFAIENEYSFEILTGVQETITIPIENNGTYILKNITADIEGDLKDYVTGTYTPEIPAGDTGYIEIELDEFEDDGTYTGTINLTINDDDYSTTIIITVFDDFADNIEYLNALRLSLHQAIITLQQEGTYVGDVEESLESLQASINELDSLYASEKYLEAKDLLDTLQAEANEIETSVTVLQAASTPQDNSDAEESIENYCGDGFCDLGESCDCSDCRYEEQCEEIPSSGSSNTFIIIFVVLLVIVGGVVIATSIVPDDWEENQ